MYRQAADFYNYLSENAKTMVYKPDGFRPGSFKH